MSHYKPNNPPLFCLALFGWGDALLEESSSGESEDCSFRIKVGGRAKLFWLGLVFADVLDHEIIPALSFNAVCFVLMTARKPCQLGGTPAIESRGGKKRERLWWPCIISSPLGAPFNRSFYPPIRAFGSPSSRCFSIPRAALFSLLPSFLPSSRSHLLSLSILSLLLPSHPRN